MPSESSSSDKHKSKQRPTVRRRDYVDSFRWGFVHDDEAGTPSPKPKPDKPGVKKAVTKKVVPPVPAVPEESADAVAPPPKQSRRQKKSAKITEPTAPSRSTPKAPSAPRAKSDGQEAEKPSIKPAKTPADPLAKQSQSVPGKRSPKRKGAKKTVLSPYVAQSNDDDIDDDLKLPSYGRTPIPTDDELPVPQKIPSKGQRSKKAAPIATPQPAGAILSDAILPDVISSDAIPCDSIPGGFRPRREQMVWDPDKSEYVPLVTSQAPAPATLVSATPKPVAPQKPTKPERPVPQTKKPDPAKKSVKRQEPAEKPVEQPVEKPKAEQTKSPQTKSPKSPLPPKKRSERPAPPKDARTLPADSRRSDAPKLIDSSKPDPADIEAEVSGFAELGVSDAMLEALKMIRYLEPTPIQAGVFQKVQAGVDLMGQAHTGTGKTAAFSMPIIEGVETCPPGNDPVALILVPTRELAVQVRDEATRLAYDRDIRITACYGGKPIGKQIERLKAGIDILVGTPGRILDLMNRRALSLDAIRWVVLDEADRMLDIGFRPDIEKILRRTPQDRQTLLFSATLPQPVVRLAEKYMKSPEVLDFSNKSVAVDTIEQFYVTVDPERKFDALVYLLEEQQPKQAIIFTRTKRGADRLARLLSKRFDKLAAIHGDMQQNDRDRVMAQVRSGSIKYLVATDVVGRGIDVSSVSHIINYDIPKFCDDYVHRVGRTGRMGRDGVAFTFVTVQEGSELTRIEMRIDKLLQRAELKGFESFTKPHDPNASLDDDPPEPPKPVFGKPVRKVRRAL